MLKAIDNIRNFGLSKFLDHFIPMELQVQPEAHRRARMFMISHVFGPIISSPLPLFMMITNVSRDYRVIVFWCSILLFWVFPFALKKFGHYQLISFISLQNLIFCVLWACYAFGGTSSPFLSWILIFPLLSFLYLPPRGWVRNALLVQIFGSVAVFLYMYVSGVYFPNTDMDKMQIIGLISTGSVAVYFAMMSLYFARMYREQREFTREINALISTSDNLRNLTLAANQASAAKADFVASMSHELRTPLNAIIGYSQMLLEEAHEENDETMAKDLGYVHKAGSDLLRLIDDILDYSRIDAGKMPLNQSFDNCGRHVAAWAERIAMLKHADCPVEIVEEAGSDLSISTDWSALKSTICHLILGIISHHDDGRIVLSIRDGQWEQNHALQFDIINYGPDGEVRQASVSQEMFEHNADASSSKYGGTGIEIALSFKFVQLLGGTIRAAVMKDGSPSIQLFIPDLSVQQTPQRLVA